MSCSVREMIPAAESQPQRVWNPPNPYLSEHREWLGEPPSVELEVYEERAKSILSENDSPDVGFRWSVNPYRGCFHACAYCLSGDTPILMGDGRTRLIADLRVGDVIYGTVKRGDYRRYVRTRVLGHWETVKPAYRIHLEDGTQLIANKDHRFLTNRGWKYVTGSENGPARRPHLTPNVELMGIGRFAEPVSADAEYRRGYLSGMIRGDGLLGTYWYDGRRRERDVVHQFRLALVDYEALQRTRAYLLSFDVETFECAFGQPTPGRKPMQAIRTNARSRVEHIFSLIEWPVTPSFQWSRGFLAGMFDAEGSYSCGVFRIANSDPEIIDQILFSFRQMSFDCAIDSCAGRSVQNVRIRGGLREVLRFFHLTDPAITRKRNIEGHALKGDARLRVAEVQPLGFDLPMFDITTETGDFIANGVVSHNCYARPTHEYLGYGAGTDFERKIVVKPNASELLEAAFRRPSWQGERIAFSGVTDCYQPLEAVWKLTQGCLKVCLAFRNPVGIITKSLLIRRDVEILKALVDQADARVYMSIAFLDEDIVRVMEPGTPTIRKRFETMRILSKAGIPVGIGIAPVIPGLNDRDIPGLLKEAKRNGAHAAFHSLLRLSGSVREVFFHRLRTKLPLHKSRVESRIREVRNGKLSDSRFGFRHTGQGTYWETVDRLWEVWTKRLGFNESEQRPAKPPSFHRPPMGGQEEFSFQVSE